MDFFERELRRLFGHGAVDNPVYVGRACYGDLGGGNKARLEFTTLDTHEKYEGIKASVINQQKGLLDSVVVRFADILGKRRVDNPNFKDGIVPYVWTCDGKSRWYVYEPTERDLQQLAGKVVDFLEVYRIPEQQQEQGGMVMQQ